MQATVSANPTGSYRENYAYSLGIQAYIYGYPLVLLEKTRQKQFSIQANVDEEATCPRAFVDDQGNPLNDKKSNWLPAPDGDFNLVLRMYQTSAKVLNGTYEIPGVKRVP